MMKFFYMETWGCAANQNNSEIMKGLLVQSGLSIISNEKLADIIILNTCIVKEPTENSIKDRILELEKLEKPIIVAGCMPQVRQKWLKRKNLYLLGINHIKDICKLVKKVQESRAENIIDNKKEIKLNSSKIRNNKFIGITQISEGCLGNCNYCLTKLVKGDLYSYQEKDILNNINQDLENGCKEIWLTSQDLASYGLDSDTNLIKLLKKILSINKKFKLRLGMMNPNHLLPILDELLEIYKDSRVYKFLHIPLQSGSNKILKSMNRKYSKEQFIEIVRKFRTLFPEMIIATDIIVAYPKETESDFQETLEVMKETKPDVVNFTRFWPMSGTRAASLEQIDRKTASIRAAEVQKLHLQISQENNEKFEGKELLVFVNEQEGTNCLARDENYRLVVIKSTEKLLGKLLKLKVKKAFSHYLLAEVI